MTDEIRAPFLSYEDIRGKADEFLALHHPDGTIPVPIERIVEFKLGMDIVPVPGLRGVIEAEGFTTSDLRVRIPAKLGSRSGEAGQSFRRSWAVVPAKLGSRSGEAGHPFRAKLGSRSGEAGQRLSSIMNSRRISSILVV